VLAVAIVTGITSPVVLAARPAGADPVAAAKAQASAVEAKLQATQQQLAADSNQYEAASYKVAQLDASIARGQAELASEQATVSKDQGQLRTQALDDYMTNGSSSQLTTMFSSDGSTAGIRSEYSSIARGNVATTIDQLHTAEAVLSAQQASLARQESQAKAAEGQAAQAKASSAVLVSQYQTTLDGLNAQIKQLVAQQQAAAAAAAAAAFRARLAAQQAAQQAAQATLGTAFHTVAATSLPPLLPGAAGAVQAAEREVGVPYVWGGTTPAGFDCSGLVMWAYAQVGISLPHFSGAQYDVTIHIPLADIQPGDILFYGPGGTEHEAMYVGGGMMVEAPYTGASVHITPVRTGPGFAGVGRVP
jgi:cell wall-associated NlpC family hydrolase